MSKLIYKEKVGDRRVIHLGKIKFSYKVKSIPFFDCSQPSALYEKALNLSEISQKDFSKYSDKDLYYYLFENVFYDKEVITKIQKNYVQFLPQNSDKHFFDVGCGRGEFLEILRENGIKAKGIEINSVEKDLLASRGFDVTLADAVTYLKNTTEIFSGISAIEVVEHLTFDYLYEFIHLAYEHIEDGGVILLETLNPYNIENLKNFYTDLTHVKPVVPESLQFMCEKTGFKNIKVCKSCPYKGCYVNYAIVGQK